MSAYTPTIRGAVRFTDADERDRFLNAVFPDCHATDVPGLYTFEGLPPAESAGLTGDGWVLVRALDVEWSQDDRLG